MAHKMFFLVALLAVASADNPPTYSTPHPPYEHPEPSYHDPDPKDPPYYHFIWKVHDDYSGNHYGQEESRKGYDTEGFYHVLHPDGRTQTVEYVVDGKSGFVANVNFQGDAHYPTYHPDNTYKPHPTHKPHPTQKPHPTYKPHPTHEPDSIYKPHPTHEPDSIYKPRPTHEPVYSYQPLYPEY